MPQRTRVAHTYTYAYPYIFLLYTSMSIHLLVYRRNERIAVALVCCYIGIADGVSIARA